jgi:hypothetical protein
MDKTDGTKTATQTDSVDTREGKRDGIDWQRLADTLATAIRRLSPKPDSQPTEEKEE